MEPHKIIQELKAKYLKELGLGLKFKAKGKLSEEARALMKADERALIEHLITKAYETTSELKHRAEAGMTPITLEDLALAVKVACNGDLVMKEYLVRWANNPTLYKRKLLECLAIAHKEQQTTNKESDSKVSELTPKNWTENPGEIKVH